MRIRFAEAANDELNEACDWFGKSMGAYSINIATLNGLAQGFLLGRDCLFLRD
jgi:hypothetical protein